jgi:hypothetical protein
MKSNADLKMNVPGVEQHVKLRPTRWPSRMAVSNLHARNNIDLYRAIP